MTKTIWVGLAWTLALSLTAGCAGQRPFVPGSGSSMAKNDLRKNKPAPNWTPQTASFPSGGPGTQSSTMPPQGGPMPGNMMTSGTMPGGISMSGGQMTGGPMSPGGAMMMPMTGGPDAAAVQQAQFQQRPIATNAGQTYPGSTTGNLGAPNPANMQPFGASSMPPTMVPESLSRTVP